MHRYLAISLLLVGCHKPDECERLFDKMLSAAKTHGAGVAAEALSEKDQGIAGCRKDIEHVRSDPMAKCMLDAPTDEAYEACSKQFPDTFTKRNPNDPQLDVIAQRAEAYFAAHGKFPIGKAAVLPPPNHPDFAAGCCSGTRKNMCAETGAWATDPTWSALGFRVTGDSFYSYSYESADGTTYHATATGDLDCDNAVATFTADGSIASGKPVSKLTKPPAGTF